MAMKGELEVIMPRSEVDNATVRARFDTYREDYKLANNISTPDAFLYEINAGKSFLLKCRNKVFEHNILCVWRIILFSEHCIVQNYFPNVSKGDSFEAPMFVYAKNAGSENPLSRYSYYYLYSAMFDLIRSTSTEFTLQTPP
jgi:hypothetical protein